MSKKFFAITLFLVGFFAVPVFAVSNTSVVVPTGYINHPQLGVIKKDAIIMGDSPGQFFLYYKGQDVSILNGISSISQTEGDLKIAVALDSLPRDASLGIYEGETAKLKIDIQEDKETISSIVSQIIYLSRLNGKKDGEQDIEIARTGVQGHAGNTWNNKWDITIPAGLNASEDYLAFKIKVKTRYYDTQEKSHDVYNFSNQIYYLKRAGCPIISYGDVKYENKAMIFNDLKIFDLGYLKDINNNPVEIASANFGIRIYDVSNKKELELSSANMVPVVVKKDTIFTIKSKQKLIELNKYSYQVEGKIKLKDNNQELTCMGSPEYITTPEVLPDIADENILSGNPAITSVSFSNLPRDASEGVFPGELISVSWFSRDIPETAKMNIYLYNVDEKGKKINPVLIGSGILNSGKYDFAVPSTLLDTTEPDYKPYIVSVEIDYKLVANGPKKNIKTFGNGYIYIKRIGCPVFDFSDIRYENNNAVQDIIINSVGNAKKGTMTFRIYDVTNSQDTRNPAEWGKPFSVDFSTMRSFSLKSSLEFVSNRKYYFVFLGDFIDKDEQEITCISRKTIVAPIDLYKNQQKSIIVTIAEDKKEYNYGDTITVKWKTTGIKSNEFLYIGYENQIIDPNSDTKTKTMPVLAALGSKKIVIYKTLSEALAKNQQFGFLGSSPFMVSVKHYDTTNNITRGLSSPFSIAGDSNIAIKLNKIETNQNGIIFDANVIDWKNLDQVSCNLGVRVLASEITDDNEKYRTDPLKSDSVADFETTKVLINKQNPRLLFYYPSKSLKDKYQGYVLYKTSRRYTVNLYCDLGENDKHVLVAKYEPVIAPKYVSVNDVKVEDLGYYLANNRIEARGKVVYQGYSSDGAVPYVEIDTTRQGLMGNEETGNYRKEGLTDVNNNNPIKLKSGKIFSITIDEIDTSKPLFYRICARDTGDGFTSPAVNCTNIVQTIPLSN